MLEGEEGSLNSKSLIIIIEKPT